MGLGAAVEPQREVGHALRPLAEVAAPRHLDADEAPPQEELQQRDVVDGEVPQHAHVGLEEAQVDAQRVVVADLAQLAGVDQLGDLPHRPRVHVGVVHHEHAPLAPGDLDQHLGLGAGGGQGLRDQDVLAGLEGGQAELVMGADRGGDDDGLDFRPGDQLGGVLEHPDAGMAGLDGLPAVGAPLGHGRQPHAAYLAEIASEIGSPVAEADQSDAQFHGPPSIGGGPPEPLSP